MKDIDKFEAFVADNNWIFAKTYAEWAPHEYVVKDKLEVQYQKAFPEVVLFIRKYGFPMLFGDKEHIYLYYDKHYYWTMGDPPEETIIINRCKYDDYRMAYKRAEGAQHE